LALADAAQWGITSAQDNSEWEDFLTFEQLEKEGKLTLRIAEWLPFDESLDKLNQARTHHPAADSMLHTTMLKGFMDGSLGSRTAAMLVPYKDDPKNSGIPRYEQELLDAKAVQRAKAGFQLGFHAIGDRGARMAMTAFELAQQQSTKRDFRFRIEHAQVVAPEDYKKFHDLGVIASMQPNHLLTDMNWAEAHIGAERAKHSYAWKEFLEDGVVLAFWHGLSCRAHHRRSAASMPPSRARMKPEPKNISPNRNSAFIRLSPLIPPAPPMPSLPRKKKACSRRECWLILSFWTAISPKLFPRKS